MGRWTCFSVIQKSVQYLLRSYRPSQNVLGGLKTPHKVLEKLGQTWQLDTSSYGYHPFLLLFTMILGAIWGLPKSCQLLNGHAVCGLGGFWLRGVNFRADWRSQVQYRQIFFSTKLEAIKRCLRASKPIYKNCRQIYPHTYGLYPFPWILWAIPQNYPNVEEAVP